MKPSIERATLHRLCAALLLLVSIYFQGSAQSGAPADDSFLGILTFPLWENGPPEALGNAVDDTPTLTIFRPHPGTANGTAIVIVPGGAYLGLAANLEGRQVADWFASRGVTAFVLKYRLGAKYTFPVPLLDARRAIRLVRSRAKEFGVLPNRIGMMGFSAGGHLTAVASTMFEGGEPNDADVVERVSSRPDFQILGYPWLNAMKADGGGNRPYCLALRLDAVKCQAFEQYSPDMHVTEQTPPAFIYHTTDDELVPVDTSVTFYRALRSKSVPAEMHIFATGKHGSGLGLGDAALDLWPTLLEAWLRARGLLTRDPALKAEADKAKAPPAPRKPGAPFSVDLSIGELLDNAQSKAVLAKHLGNEFVQTVPASGRELSLRQIAEFIPDQLNPAKLQAIESDLSKIPVAPDQ